MEETHRQKAQEDPAPRQQKGRTPYRHKVQYYETDQMKIVHHSNYIRWFEEARTDFLEKSGFSYEWMERQGIIIPVLSVEAEYRSMVRYGDEVLIDLMVESFNGVRLVIRYEVRDAKTGERKTVGKSSHCFLDADYRLLRLKKEFPEVYRMFQDSMKSPQNS